MRSLCEVLHQGPQTSLMCSSGYWALPTDTLLCHIYNVCILFGDLWFTLWKEAQHYRESKEMNKIDSSLAEITLPFMLDQILFCLKGCLFASWKGILLKWYWPHAVEVRGSKQQPTENDFLKKKALAIEISQSKVGLSLPIQMIFKTAWMIHSDWVVGLAVRSVSQCVQIWPTNIGVNGISINVAFDSDLAFSCSIKGLSTSATSYKKQLLIGGKWPAFSV